MSCPFEVALDVKTRHRDGVLSLPGVEGIGVGHRHAPGQEGCSGPGGHHLLVYAGRGAVVPTLIEGVQVVRKTSDDVRSFALAQQQQQQKKYETVRTLGGPAARAYDSLADPVAGGNSVGAYSSRLGAYVTGTLGMVFQNSAGTFALSNNHVLCGISTIQKGGATDGAPITQPGPYFSGPSTTFAALNQWLNIDELNPNQIDWAAAVVSDPTKSSPDILGIGTPDSIADPVAGLVVQKSGALSGLTTGQVIDTDASVTVNYEDLFTATFDDQIVMDNTGNYTFAQPGDSGSMVVANTGDHIVACGLLFAGSSGITMANKMTLVQKQIPIPLPLGTLTAPPGATGTDPTTLLYAGIAFSGASALLARIFL